MDGKSTPLKYNLGDRERSLAIEVQDAFLKYGIQKKSPMVLNGLNMNVSQSQIYALLGPSGCGKTTTLKCIIKQLKLTSGLINLPLNQGRGVNVPDLGIAYMPQDLSLFPNLTIKETLNLFGAIYGLPSSKVKERTKMLTREFDLPPGYRIIANLSGGQKRRVSLISTFLHDASIFVLDEPTVGLDPILRQTVWKYLQNLIKTENKTILLTTHYIDEAKDADIVGLMRDGRMLVESCPSDLLARFKVQSLEKCFYKLCIDGTGKEKLNNPNGKLSNRYKKINCSDDFQNNEETKENIEFISIKRQNDLRRTAKNIITLIRKNLWVLKRSYLSLAFQIFIPAITVILFGMCIGERVFGIPVAIVNDENPPYLSNRYLKYLDEKPVIQNFYKTIEEGKNSVFYGENRVAVHFHKKFSHCLIKRLREGINATNETMQCSFIKLHMDTTNHIVALELQFFFWKTFQDFEKKMLENLAVHPSIGSPPIEFQKPIYGNAQIKFSEYITPTILLVCSYFLASILTAESLVLEKQSGVLVRLEVAGVTKMQIFSAQLATNIVVVLAQLAIMLTVQFTAFDFPIKGSVTLVVTIIFLQGFCGIMFGVFLSSLANSMNSVIILGLSLCYPNLILCGLVWPLEGMPSVIRFLARFVPITETSEALRSVLSRGWGLYSLRVCLGIFSATFWSTFFLLSSIFIFKYKSYQKIF